MPGAVSYVLPQDARRLSRRAKERANAGASSLHAEGSAGETIETVPRGNRAVPGRLELEAEGTASRADRVTR
jgi:hypothetical protein